MIQLLRDNYTGDRYRYGLRQSLNPNNLPQGLIVGSEQKDDCYRYLAGKVDCCRLLSAQEMETYNMDWVGVELTESGFRTLVLTNYSHCCYDGTSQEADQEACVMLFRTMFGEVQAALKVWLKPNELGRLSGTILPDIEPYLLLRIAGEIREGIEEPTIEEFSAPIPGDPDYEFH